MTRDHYAVLGVSPTSEDVVIRAAYRALMRRYHPDADPSNEAAQRAKAINAAYAVLGDPERRARYDGSLAAQGLIKPEPPHRQGLARRFVPGPAAIVGLAALAAAITLLAISPPIGVLPPDSLSMSAEPRVNRAADEHTALSTAQIEAEALCQDSAVSSLIKQELLRNAADMPGADRERLGRIASYSVLRLDSATSKAGEAGGAAACRAFAALDLPPGMAVDGGRTNLNAELAYGVARSDDSVRLASLSGAGGLIQSLATIAPAAAEPAPELDEIRPDELASVRPAPAPPPIRPAPVEARPKAAGVASARAAPPKVVASAAPSKEDAAGCRLGDGWADRAVCGNDNLTGLNRQMDLLYSQSWSRADESKRAALLGSRQRFQERRNACRSEGCLTSAYVARLREISDIMARRSQQ